MDLRQLRCFAAVAEFGSFSEAARQLRVAQPALSRHVKLLEREFGVVLFVRTVRGVEITEAGERLFHHARDVLQQLQMVPQIVLGRNNTVGGRVAIGIPNSVSVVLARPLLRAAVERHPQVQLHFVESVSGFLQELVETGRLDLAILFDARESANVRLDKILVEDLCLVGPAGSLGKGKDSIAFAQLGNFPLVLPSPANAHRRLLEATALSHGIRLKVALEIDSLAITLASVEERHAFAILAPGVVQEKVAAGVLDSARIVDPTVSRSVSLARSTVRGRTRACEVFGRMIQEIAGDLRDRGIWEGRSPA